jgi:hypothetical protein
MTTDEVIDLLSPALLGLGRRNVIADAEWLDDQLGVTHYRDYQFLHSADKPAPEDYKNLLRQLAGPHAHAILKAYRIKKGLEHADSD